MRAILVDDERLALHSLSKLLEEIGGLEIVGRYQDPRLALEESGRIKPDVVFLDVEMPGVNGLDAAEQLLGVLPDTDVVFVTGFDEYAVRAFELNALDYVLKPVRRDRLTQTVQRIAKRQRQERTAATASSSAMIRCFQSLQFESAAGKTQAIRWRTTKAQELFAYLLYRRGQPVRKDVLLELFWPETDCKKGITQLYTTVYQIRKTLEAIGIAVRIDNHDEGYLLKLNGVKLDFDEWEQGIQQLPVVNAETLATHLALLELYRGDFLAECDYLWAESERQRLRTIWLQHALQVAAYLIDQEQYTQALIICHRIVRYCPHAEEGHFMLMRLFDKLGDPPAVERQYAKLVGLIQEEFGTEPQASIQAWYRQWKNNGRKHPPSNQG